MKKNYTLFVGALLCTLGHAQETTLKLSYESFDFENSKKKDKGKRYGAILGYETNGDLYQIAYDRSNIDTFKPPLTEDLHANKYYLKYTHALDEKQFISASYATIEDNIMKETDGGNVYGLGYQYNAFGLTQYATDYHNFNVYQSDIKYTFKKTFGEFETAAVLMGTYIHLQNKDSNDFSANAKEDYFTPALKIHTHYRDYHMGVGAYFGKRVFAVLNDGFRVQHHAMEFNETYMVGVGKSFANIDVNLKYVYQEATEIPTLNENVEAQNVVLEFTYRF